MDSPERAALDHTRRVLASLVAPRVNVVAAANLGEIAPPPAIEELGVTLTRWHPNELEPASHPTAVACVQAGITEGRAETVVRFLRDAAPKRMTTLSLADTHGIMLIVFSDDPPPETLPVAAPAPSASLIFDTAGVVVSSGGRLEELLGIGSEELVHQTLLPFMHPDDNTATVTTFGAILADHGVAHHVRLRLATSTGAWRWVEFHGVAEPDGDLVRVRCTISDIDDEMRAIDELDRSERRFRTLAESIPIGVFRADADGIVHFANAELRRLHPLAVDQSRWTDLVHRVDLPLLRDALLSFGDPDSTRDDGEVLDGIFRLAVDPEAAPGPQRVIRILARAVHDEAGVLSEVVGSVDDVTERRELEARLEHAANHDSLTGLANRAALATHLEQRIVHSGNDRVTVLFVDLDGFKRINDSLGHTVGDELLSTIARRIRDAVRPEDFVVRFGGDEFVIVSDQPRGADGALALAHRVLSAVSEPLELRGSQVRPRASIGVAIAAGSGPDAESLLRDADAAMYAAKASDSSMVRIADEAIRTAAARRMSIEAALSEPTEAGGGFWFAYQPIFELNGGHLVGAESLIRWNHPVLGFISPLEMLPIAEDTGAIHSIAAWGMDRAASDLPVIRAAHPALAEARIGVNLSNVQLARPGFVRGHREFLDRHGLRPADLVVEVTETNLIELSDPAELAIHELHELGVPIALDDFGAGYSSLEYLTRLPVDCLKIDRGMVARIAERASSRKVVEGLARICDSLGILVIAEGIENLLDLEHCRDLGIQYGQGYYLARPQPLDQMLQWASIEPAAAVCGTNVPGPGTMEVRQ